MAVKRRRFRVSQVFIYTILILWSLTTVLPFLWVVVNSFKNKDIIQTNAFSLFFEPTLDNYIKTFTRPPQSVGMAYLNSVIISGTVTVLVMLFAGMAAFAMIRYRFRGRKALDGLIVASLMFPVFSTIIPVFQMLSAVRVVDRPFSRAALFFRCFIKSLYRCAGRPLPPWRSSPSSGPITTCLPSSFSCAVPGPGRSPGSSTR